MYQNEHNERPIAIPSDVVAACRRIYRFEEKFLGKPFKLRGKSAVFIAEGLDKGAKLDFNRDEMIQMLELATDTYSDNYTTDKCNTNYPAVKHRLTPPADAVPTGKRLRSWQPCSSHVGQK